MRTDELLSRLDKVKGRNGRWIACCPAHDDRSPSLTIAEGDDGRILLHCFGGCPVENVVGAVGLSLSDIMPEGPAPSIPAKHLRFNASQVLEAMAFNAMIVALLASDMGQGKPLSTENKDKLTAIAGEFQQALAMVKGQQ